MKKNALRILTFLIMIIICILIFAACNNKKKSTINIDFSVDNGAIHYGATGFLYGLAEPDVPSGNLLQGINTCIIAVKAPDGKQHPIGDVLNIVDIYKANGGERLLIYMQDIYPDWYYHYEGQADYVQKVQAMMEKIIDNKYINSFIYCPFNENDNGLWYNNDFSKKENRLLFYADWLAVYNTIKSYDNDAVIAGPGYMTYNDKYIEEFLSFALANNCMPDMMVWHEISSKSFKNYEKNYKNYRNIETRLSIEPLEICISEYGRPEDNGNPGAMIQFIAMLERTKVNACIAYWRLANNLCELASDNNTPTSAWWLYHWYSELKGQTYSLKSGRTGKGFDGLVSYDIDQDSISILVGGNEDTGYINLNNITNIWQPQTSVDITIEYIDYNGLQAKCYNPTLLTKYTDNIVQTNLNISIDNMCSSRAYRIIISPTKGVVEDYVLQYDKIRYQAEDAKISGIKKTEKRKLLIKDVYYASSGSLVSTSTNSNYKLAYTINAPIDSFYRIDVVYGNEYSPTNNKVDRTFATTYYSIDNSNYNLLYLPNTINKICTNSVSINTYLTAGQHTISFANTNQDGQQCIGTVTYDFIDVMPVTNIELSPQITRISEDKQIIVSEENAYYEIEFYSACDLTVNSISYGKVDGKKTIFLLSGINIIDCKEQYTLTKLTELPHTLTLIYNGITTYEDTYSPSGFSMNDATGIDNNITLQASVEKAGVYALTMYYSNNEEIGTHDYNVELVERYAKIVIGNDDPQIVYFRNTYSYDSYSTKTIFVYLDTGTTNVTIYNDNSIIWNDNMTYLPRIVKIDMYDVLAN